MSASVSSLFREDDNQRNRRDRLNAGATMSWLVSAFAPDASEEDDGYLHHGLPSAAKIDRVNSGLGPHLEGYKQGGRRSAVSFDVGNVGRPPLQTSQPESRGTRARIISSLRSQIFEDKSGQPLGVMGLGRSVYDGALIVPIVLGQSKRRYLNWCFLLALNAFLQSLVVIKVDFLSSVANEITTVPLFDLCRRVNSSEMEFAKRLATQPQNGKYYDCAPGAITAMSTTRNLDMNSDGYWTMADVKSFSNVIKGDLPWANLTRVFVAMSRLAARGRLQAQRGRDLHADSEQFQGFTSIPLPWLAQEERLMAICAITDPKLCGNLEARRALEWMLPDISSVDARVSKCEDIARNYCMELFGERYKLYVTTSRELCGQQSVKWIESRRVPAIVYDVAHRYANDKDGVARPAFITFLCFVTYIWLLAMSMELRKLYQWWTVLPFYPSCPHGDPEATRARAFKLINGVELIVEWLPIRHKIWALTCILLPRTLIWAGLSYSGTNFLLCADRYTDIIFNSVALCFLIEIDDMLFSAVAAIEAKRVIDACTELCLPSGTRGKCGVWLHGWEDIQSPVGQSLAILIVAVAFIAYSYSTKGGKFEVAYALNCLCQGAGPQCVPAQIVGGLSHLPTFGATFVDEG